MRRVDWLLALQIAATYVGTVVGAGFASGQEVLQFFTRFGGGGLAGVLASTVLFFLLGYYVLTLGRNRGVTTYRDVSRLMLGASPSRLVNIVMYVMLFGVTVAMVAGSGALFAEQFGWPFFVGALLSVVVTALTLAFGMRGILSVNSLVVPAMSFFVLGTLAFSWQSGDLHQAVSQGALGIAGTGLWRSLVSAATYVGFNVGFTLTVLIPIGSSVKSRATLAVGAFFGAVLLGVLLVAMHLLLYRPEVLGGRYEVPMVHVAEVLPPTLRYVFVIVLWGEIYSTLIANVYGLARELTHEREPRFMASVIVILVAAFSICQVGFARMVTHVYPIFGYASLLILGLLVFSERRILRL